jgi:hypothetical protein
MLAGRFGFRRERLGALVIGLAACVQAQVMWQTTHTNNEGGGYASGNCLLASASVRVKVHPVFLDVEEDVEIGTVGAVGIGNDGKSLEIVGNISLPAGAAIVGALLWDGGAILEGKLLDRNTADSLYEDLVDRNSTPPVRPRDPLILEKTGPGTYRFRIYPVALGFSRHMRLRYQLPPVVGPEGVLMPFKAAVTSLFGNTSNLQVPVTLENGGGVPKGIFTLPNGTRTEMTFPRTRLLTAAEVGDPGTGWDVWGNQVYVPGIGIQPVVPLRQAAVKTTFAAGQMAGNFLSLYATVSQEVLKGLNIRSATSLAVVVRNGKRSYDIPVSCEGGLALGCGSMSFHGKSDSAWNDTLDWEAFDAAGKLLARTRVKSTVYQSAQDTGAAVLWAASPTHFSEKKELPVGPVFGFVDEWASLLSLPKDSVGPQLFAFYNENGVPRISNASLKDVIPNYAPDQIPNPNIPGGPTVPWNPNLPTTALAAKLGSFTEPATWRVERIQGGGFLIRIPGMADGMKAVVEMYDLSGKPVGNWAPRSEGGALTLSSAAVRPGIYVVKIRIAGKMAVKRIMF